MISIFLCGATEKKTRHLGTASWMVAPYTFRVLLWPTCLLFGQQKDSRSKKYLNSFRNSTEIYRSQRFNSCLDSTSSRWIYHHIVISEKCIRREKDSLE
ncbi:hypothetical protein V1478_005380 [Vespula squamosa]|uniref:Uncharacterized protein n=1 Tax=Vespula squamosa TaxID=30214 RepID=A0ABD2BDZ8_VESSQ